MMGFSSMSALLHLLSSLDILSLFWVVQASFEPLGFTVAVAKDRAIESLMQVHPYCYTLLPFLKGQGSS